jgi:hypothetical protein
LPTKHARRAVAAVAATSAGGGAARPANRSADRSALNEALDVLCGYRGRNAVWSKNSVEVERAGSNDLIDCGHCRLASSREDKGSVVTTHERTLVSVTCMCMTCDTRWACTCEKRAALPAGSAKNGLLVAVKPQLAQI